MHSSDVSFDSYIVTGSLLYSSMCRLHPHLKLYTLL